MRFLNSVGETGTYTDTTTDYITLGGTAIQGHQTFSNAGAATNDEFLIKAVAADGDWLLGICDYNSTTGVLTATNGWLDTSATAPSNSDSVQVFIVSHYAEDGGLHFGPYNERVTTVSAAGTTETVTLDGTTYHIGLDESCDVTLAAPSGAASGTCYSALIVFEQDGTGTNSISWLGGTTRINLGTQTDSTTGGDFFAYLVMTLDGGTTFLIMPAGTE
jgi:hypothetical protein